jgi:uracil-DNA glycosylase
MTFYAVAVGRKPGIYEQWVQAEPQIKSYPGAIYKGFPTMEEASIFMTENRVPLHTTTLETLTEEQCRVLDHLLRGDNVFLTGGGGVGKSYLLSVIYTEFPGMKQKRTGSIPRIQICALTGCAALLLGHKAKTIHSWSGIGLGKGTVSELYVKIRKNRKSMQKWLTTDLLIIDEVSMMTDDILNKLNELGKKIRGSKKPFGGIQLLLVGDFFQLPPVNKGDEKTVFAFESDAWKEAIHYSIELTQIQRQKDVIFQKILKEARLGSLTMESCAILRGREGLDWKDNKIKPTLLFPRRSEVEMINDSNLRALTGRKYTYKTRLVYDGKTPKGFTEADENFQQVVQHFDSNAPYARELELMQGAQVMLIANVEPDSGLVNGSRGIITGFCSSTELPMVEFMNGIKKLIGTHAWPIEEYEFVSRTQIPLRLAWAITIHKCISSDTLLSLPNRGLIQIKDLESKQQSQGTIYNPKDSIFVSGISEQKHIIEIYKGFIEDGIKLQTSFGYEIKGSYRHPLLIYNKDTHMFEWKKLPEINVNDYIIIKKGAKVEGSYYSLQNISFNNKPYNLHITIPNYIGEQFGYLLGIILGDGSINNKTYRFDFLSMDFDIIDSFKTIIRDLFNIHIELHQYKKRKTQTWRIFFHSKQLVEVFNYIGYKFEHAPKKEIPLCILQSPISVQKKVLQGLFDTDGGVSPSTLNFTTTSYNMGQQIQQMLLNIGILCSMHTLHEENVEKKWSKAYRLSISGKSAVQFNTLIGFACKRKKILSENRFKLTDKLQKDNKSQAFEIPNGFELITKLRNEMYNGLKRLNTDTQITKVGRKLLSSLIRKTQKLRSDSICVLIESIYDIQQYTTGKLLYFMYHSGIMIDTVKTKILVSDMQMYDIGVSPLNSSGYLPDGHDFIAAGFVNHNCQGSTLDSALVDIGSGNFEYGQAYVALSRARSLEALYVYDFDPVAFKAHPKVKAFYQNLVVAEMSEEERSGIRSMLKEEADVNVVKAVYAEQLKAVKGITVIKEDCIEDASVGDALVGDALEPGAPAENWLYESVPTGWKAVLEPCKEKLLELSTTLLTKAYLPKKEEIWAALALTPLSSIKVVILGQDPYPTPGNAHGLAFSVLPNVKPLPASLKNIYKERVTDLQLEMPANGSLISWAEQGILLLNTVLTVEAGAPQSHSKIGWEEVTDQIIRAIAAQKKNVVFVLWGKSAQVKKKLLGMYLEMNQHKVFESAHPSPLSATKGFFGSKPFSTVNGLLKEMGQAMIQW